MPLFLMAELMAGSALFTLGTLHLAIGSRTGAAREHILFSIAVLLAAAEAFCAPWQYHAVTSSEFVLATKLSGSLLALLGLAWAWFVAQHADLRQTWIPNGLTVYGTLVVLLHLSLPAGLLFNRIPVLRELYLPWGERIVRPVGSTNPWFFVASAFGFLSIAYTLWGCVSLWRQKTKSRSKTMWLALGLAPLILVTAPQELMVDWGLLPLPYLHTVFLALVLMSLVLVRESVQTTRLTLDKDPNGRRWRSFLENVNLLVASGDSAGRLDYVNPFFLRVSGYKESELLGQTYRAVLPDRGEHRLLELFERGVEKAAAVTEEADLVTKGGERRKIIWSHVPLGGESETSVFGTLSVGVDVTERAKAEADRDLALEELQKLRSKLEAENVYLKEEVDSIAGSPDIIGESGPIRYLLRKIQQVSKTDASVLIEGEAGVGKELVARAVHEGSPRSRGPFVRVNCAALPPAIVESELFGHEKSASTGAGRLRKGRLDLAEGGTLFLDEVGELSLEIQARLLRVLQEGEFERVGSSHSLKANVRVVAATNRNLRLDVLSGRFREDLFYRLQVFLISVPPLRERREDIPGLVKHLALQLALKHGKLISEVPGDVIAALMEWDWPGNVRELANIVELAVITSKGDRLTLPPEFLSAHSASPHTPSPETEGRKLVSLAEMERHYILRVLERTNWRVGGKGGAAEILELHPNTLRTRMEKLGITRTLGRSPGTRWTEIPPT